MLLLTFPAWSYGQEGEIRQDSSDASVEAIQLADVPSESESLLRLLDTEAIPLIQRPVVSDQIIPVDSLRDSIQSLRRLTDMVVENNLPFFITGTAISRWNRFREALNRPEERLQNYAGQLAELNTTLNEAGQRWQLSQELAIEREAPPELMERIDRLLLEIDSVQRILNDSLARSLNLQSAIVDIKLDLDNYINRLNTYQAQSIGELLTKRSTLLWKSDSTLSRATRDSIGFDVILDLEKDDTAEFIKQEQGKLTLIGLFFLTVLWLLYWMRNRYNELQEKEVEIEELELGRYIFGRPILAALLFTLILQSWILPVKPFLVEKAVSLVLVVLFIALIPGLIPRALRWSIYFLAGVSLLSELDQLLSFLPSTARWIYMAESVAMAAFLWWFLRQKAHLRPRSRSEYLWFGFLAKTAPIFLLFFLVAIAGNILGYVPLAVYVNGNTLTAFLVWLVLGAAYRIAEGLVYLYLQTDYARGFYLVQQRKERIFQLITSLLKFGTIGLWTYYTLVQFMLWKPFTAAVNDFLDIGYVFGEIQITIGDILGFIVILLLSWGIAHVVRILLEEEILIRFRLPRGVPMAIASLTNYALILIGFFLALAAVGFDLSNIGLLAGALGVGIGFGLQNIISNFISGLILIFERPITVGDVIEVQGITGTVIAIGIRSSRILQFNGDEEIIPNATFISGRVTNRTLSDARRRYILRINTSLDADPEAVLPLMEEACRAQEDVLADPPPRAYFEGIVDQSMQFSVFYWLSSNILDANSQANLKIHRTLKAAGVEFRIARRLEVNEVGGETQNASPSESSGPGVATPEDAGSGKQEPRSTAERYTEQRTPEKPPP